MQRCRRTSSINLVVVLGSPFLPPEWFSQQQPLTTWFSCSTLSPEPIGGACVNTKTFHPSSEGCSLTSRSNQASCSSSTVTSWLVYFAVRKTVEPEARAAGAQAVVRAAAAWAVGTVAAAWAVGTVAAAWAATSLGRRAGFGRRSAGKTALSACGGSGRRPRGWPRRRHATLLHTRARGRGSYPHPSTPSLPESLRH